MSETAKIAVMVDIAGFYYRSGEPVMLDSGSTVLDAMKAVRDRDIAAATTASTRPILDFSIETGIAPGVFINEISVLHVVGAVSGQDPARIYRPGRYSYADDPVSVDPISGLLVRNDDKDLPYVLAWQYYLYDSNGTDLARASVVRKVEPVSAKILTQDVTIVWRLIAIQLRPSEPSGYKGTIAANKTAVTAGNPNNATSNT